MADYAEIDTLVGRLKQSSIDAWMRDNRWTLTGDRYEISSRGPDFTVTRPGADGEGGGDWHTDDVIAKLFGLIDRDDEFQEAFATIRSTIDGLVGRWRDLPDPDLIAPIVESSRQVTRGLAGAASSAGGAATGAGALAGYLRLIEANAQSMSGDVIASYKAKFLVQLSQAIGGFHAISVVRGAAVAAQEGLWREARRAVAEALEKTRGAMDQIAQGGSAELKDVLKVAGWAAKGVGFFASGGVAVALEVTGLSIEVLDDVTSTGDKTVEGAPGSYEAAIQHLTTVLNTLDSQIRTEEQKLQDNLVANLRNIRNDPASYDLSQPPVWSSEGVILIQPHLVDEIIKVHMPAVADELERIASEFYSSSIYAAVRRDDAVGIGSTGPAASFSDLNWLLYELVKDLAWEVRAGAKNLEAAVLDLRRHDEDTAAELRRLADKVHRGSLYDPWD
jgi:hypothetical protein